ncbi:MAG: pyridoxine 5'-phosphate synthase [Cellvibrionaceae bacterium]
MSVALSVNLNKIALIRNSREGNYPNVLAFAEQAIASGADGITVHPRPDQRHIRASDVYELAELVKPVKGVEFNVEGNPFAGARDDYPGFMKLVADTHPDQCTLVPDGDNQLTSDHGFDLKTSGTELEPIIQTLKDQNMRVSLFMDPDQEQIALAKDIGADRIELYTGPYAETFALANRQNSDHDSARLDALFQRYFNASEYATSIGLGVNGGHDLNLENLARFATAPGLLEVSIGHALTVDALEMGYTNAVRAYKAILQQL